MVVWVVSGIGLLGIAGAWLVARTVSRRAHSETRAEVMALRTELAGALARISSREEAAAIMARVDAAVADEPVRKRRAGLVLIKGGLAVAGAAGAAASGLARRAREHPGIAMVAATAAVGTAAVAMLSPFSGGSPEALREPPAPQPSATAPATTPTQVVPTKRPPTPATPHQPAQVEPKPSAPAVSPPTDLATDPGNPPVHSAPISNEPQPQPDPSTTPKPPGSDPTPDPEPSPTPKPTPTPTPTPQPDPSRHCTVRVGQLVCLTLPLPI